MATGQLQEATDRFSEVIERALGEGPQVIAVRGEPAAVLISSAEYARLTQPKPRFMEFMRSSPSLASTWILPGHWANGELHRCAKPVLRVVIVQSGGLVRACMSR